LITFVFAVPDSEREIGHSGHKRDRRSSWFSSAPRRVGISVTTAKGATDMSGITATAEIDIAAPTQRVWTALTDPDQIEKYMFGSRVDSDWTVGSAITWSGDYEGKVYQDRGEILEVDPGRRLVLTHFSPLSGQDDKPENYHTLTYELAARDEQTHLSLSQDGNGSPDEAEHARENWQQVLGGLKSVAEGS
jgi:uncharacterized protein YndB with AHSA1/START domain